MKTLLSFETSVAVYQFLRLLFQGIKFNSASALEQTHYYTRCKNPELTNHMKQNSWEANSSSSRQIPHVMEPDGSSPLWQEPSTRPNLSQINPVHVPPRARSSFFKIHFNIVLQATPRSSKWSLFLRFPDQNPVCTSAVRSSCHILCPSHSKNTEHRHLNNTHCGNHNTYIYQTTLRNFPEDLSLYQYHCENLRFCTEFSVRDFIQASPAVLWNWYQRFPPGVKWPGHLRRSGAEFSNAETRIFFLPFVVTARCAGATREHAFIYFVLRRFMI